MITYYSYDFKDITPHTVCINQLFSADERRLAATYITLEDLQNSHTNE